MCGCVKYMNSGGDFELDEVSLRANLPEGALGTDGVTSASGEDQRLQAAMAAAERSGSATPLLKEELRMHILQKRLRDGKPEIKTEFPPQKDYQLTPAEKEKKERRKEQNRRAARKCREKKKQTDCGVRQRFERTRQKHQKLRSQIETLQEFKAKMQAWLTAHLAVCCNLVLPHQPQHYNSHGEQGNQRQQQQQQEPLLYHRQGHGQQQHQQHQAQQQQHCYQQHVQLQQEPMNAETDDAMFDLISEALQSAGISLDACSTGPEHPMQGLGPTPSGEASNNLLLDSLDLDAAFRGQTDAPLSTPSLGLEPAPKPLTSFSNSSLSLHNTSTSAPPLNMPNFLQSGSPLQPVSSEAPTTGFDCSQSHLYQPVSPDSSSRGFAPLSETQPVPSMSLPPTAMTQQTPPQAAAVSSVSHCTAGSYAPATPVESLPSLDLPGYPFSGRKRRSVDDSQRATQGPHHESSKKPRLAISSSSPFRISQPGVPTTAASLGLAGVKQQQQQVERSAASHQALLPLLSSSSSAFPSSRPAPFQLNRPASTTPPLRHTSSSFPPFQHFRLNPPPLVSHNSPLIPPSVTPPPPPYSSLVPSPQSTTSAQPSPYGTSTTPPPPSPLLPQPSPAMEERAMSDDERLMCGLGSAGNAGVDDGCLNSNCSLMDFLKDLAEQQSSQED